MSNLYKPIMYQKDIFSINYDKLKEKGIKYILFDIDNTIAPTNKKNPTQSVIDLFITLKKKGLTLIILTNAIPSRALRFGKALQTKAYFLSCKPSRLNYKRICKKYQANPSEIAAVGDQLYTDIKGANKMGILSILVEPLSEKEGLLTKLNRVKEKRVINKENIIKRGVFYE